MTQKQLNQNLYQGIGRIIINRPESRNAISKEMWLAIPKIMEDLQSRGARVIVFEGSQDFFAAGADLWELQNIKTAEDAKENWQAIANCLDYVAEFALPTIAAIDGPCLGGGCLLACACDLRYASRRSTFSVPIAKLGIVLDQANLSRLCRQIGTVRTKELIYRAMVLNAEEAMNWGLINAVFFEQEFAAMIEFTVSEIIACSPVSICETKKSLLKINNNEQDDGHEEKVLASYLSDEFKSRLAGALKKT